MATKRLGMPLHQRLSMALARGEFEVNYQPLIDLESARIAGAEALLRWRQPDDSVWTPEAFMPQLEHSGLIIAVDQWVLKVASAQVMEWRAAFNPSMYVAVNLSASQFTHALLVSSVREALDVSKVEAGALEVEITEGTAMFDPDLTGKVMGQLAHYGVGLSLDDFGTGYSSLSYLQRFPFTKLKVDRSFIGDFDNDKKNSSLVNAIISMGRALELQVVAEGVETNEQLRFLQEQRCDYGQGYFFGKAMSADSMSALLAKQSGFEGMEEAV